MLSYSISAVLSTLDWENRDTSTAARQSLRGSGTISPPPKKALQLASCLHSQLCSIADVWRPLLKKCSRSFDGNASPRLSVMTPFTFFYILMGSSTGCGNAL